MTESCAISAVAHKAGIVVKRDPDELADSIRKIILDDALSRNCCLNGKTLIENEFNIESVITKIEDCYRQVSRRELSS